MINEKKEKTKTWGTETHTKRGHIIEHIRKEMIENRTKRKDNQIHFKT